MPVSVSTTYAGPIAFASDLSFRQSYDLAVEGVTVRVTASGTFDENGGLTGSVAVAPFNLQRDGRAELCRANGGFTARLQR